jgi:ABC-2 type transport system permease protein
MRRIAYLIGKEFRQVFRDRAMLRIIFVAPIIQLLILSFAITTEVKHVKLLLVDLDNSMVSREIIDAFWHTEQFDVVGRTSDLHQIRERMRGWQAQMALVIPPNFSGDLHRHLNPQIGVVADGVDGNTAGVALSYARNILMDFGSDYLRQPQNRPSVTGPSLAAMEERMWFNPDLSSQQFVVPAIVVVLLTVLPMMLSGLSLVKEKEIGTLEQLLVTPLKKHQLLAGKLIPFLILSYIELAIVMTVAVVVFKIPMNGSYVLLAALALLYLFSTMGLGIFISTVTSSQQQAMFVSWFFMVFMIMMSGFFIPIENMPSILQKLTHLNPMRYFMSIVRDIFQKGSSLPYLWTDVVPLLIFGVLIFSFSVAKFQKRIS